MSEQPNLFQADHAHARVTDPYTSDQAVKAIAKDNNLMAVIWWAALQFRREGMAFNDTRLTNMIEEQTGRRQQRNVIARSRGLMEQAGMFRKVGVFSYAGHELMHYEIDPTNKKENP